MSLKAGLAYVKYLSCHSGKLPMNSEALFLEMNEIEFSTYHEVIAWELREALERYNKIWAAALPTVQSSGFVHVGSVEQKRLTVVLLVTAMVEATINFYVSGKCDSLLFKKLQRKPLLEKWTKIPKTFLPNYELLPANPLFLLLNQLVERRNAIVHSKPSLTIDGDRRHSGNHPSIALNEDGFIVECASLPFGLLEHLLDFDRDAFALMCSVRTCCAAIASHFEKSRSRVDLK